eukprot:GGOE01022287.1.p2 GENE.GGOE01022287.1~~GGOE01022287.1.p2  ORF type:complete len:345 (-),score=24.51 GGOE01022287.1:639-1673(-)
MNFSNLLSSPNVSEISALLTVPADSLEGLSSKESLQSCSLWLRNEENEPQIVALVLRLLDRLPLTSSQVISSGIGTTTMKFRKSAAVTTELKAVAGSLIRKWSHGSVERTVAKSNTGILKRDRADVLPQVNKVPRSPVLCSPITAGKRVRFCDEAVGEPLTVIKQYDLDWASALRPVTRKADVQQERAINDETKRVLLDKLKALAPQVSWRPPPRVLVPKTVEQALEMAGRDSFERQFSEANDKLLDRLPAPETPAEPPQRDSAMEPRVYIPDKPIDVAAASSSSIFSSSCSSTSTRLPSPPEVIDVDGPRSTARQPESRDSLLHVLKPDTFGILPQRKKAARQ